MIRSIPRFCTAFRLRHWWSAGLLLACIGLAGCNNFGFRKDQLQYDPALNLGPMARPPAEESDFFGVSNKPRNIKGFAVTDKGREIESRFNR